MNEIILAPCDAGYVQSCTGFKLLLLFWKKERENSNCLHFCLSVIAGDFTPRRWILQEKTHRALGKKDGKSKHQHENRTRYWIVLLTSFEVVVVLKKERENSNCFWVSVFAGDF
jgi:hypothetical protein